MLPSTMGDIVRHVDPLLDKANNNGIYTVRDTQQLHGTKRDSERQLANLGDTEG